MLGSTLKMDFGLAGQILDFQMYPTRRSQHFSKQPHNILIVCISPALPKGKFEVLVLNEVSRACILSCVDFSHFEKLNESSVEVRSFIQLDKFHAFSGKILVGKIRMALDEPAEMDRPTGSALGHLADLFFQGYQIRSRKDKVVRQFITTVLRDFKIPRHSSWVTNKDFKNGFEDAATDCRLSFAKRQRPTTPPLVIPQIAWFTPPNTAGTINSPQTPRLKIPAIGILTPPSTGTTSGFRKGITDRPQGIQGNRVLGITNLSSAAAGSFTLNSVSSTPRRTASPSSEDDTSDSELDELSDVVGSDEALWEFAGAVRPGSDAGSDASSITLGRRHSANTGRKMPVVKRSGALPKVLWKKVDRHSAPDKGKQPSLQQATVKAWLDEAEDGANLAERGNSSANAIVID
ncbi:MAG: hypothetical protein Q9162_000247 [Coniocarpon cinnabarinum]